MTTLPPPTETPPRPVADPVMSAATPPLQSSSPPSPVALPPLPSVSSPPGPAPPPLQPANAAPRPPPAPSTSPEAAKLDAVVPLLRLSSMLGITRCENFVQLMKQNKTIEDNGFREFSSLLAAAGVIDSQSQSHSITSSATSKSLDDLFVPTQLPKNKAGTSLKKEHLVVNGI
ncbi:hypothetical protein ElyMa_003283600 [Elysia marginata]|uniref:Uncharacterized protein n=1 Tax=Elysia marginata TaxID=1093978 RepID=A0AAV4JF86_9GAST|nr:hypothetical protein ElyMa_003283600 [Elysia marginata]